MSAQTTRAARAIGSIKNELDRLMRRRASKDGRSRIWSEGCRTITYLRDLSPEELLKIRLHAGMFTGENVFQFWHPPQPIDPQHYAENSGYAQLTRGLSPRYRAGEPANPSVPIPLGVRWQGRVINKDIARFQSCLSNLVVSGAMKWLQGRPKPLRMIEIGAGYGGSALQLRRAIGRPAQIFLVDFAEMLYFPGAYLPVVDPKAPVRVLRPDGSNARAVLAAAETGYVLVPLESLPLLEGQRWDLALNLMSLQEMTPPVIESYMAFLSKSLEGFFYSYNMERHPHNAALRGKKLTDFLRRRFTLFPNPAVYDSPGLGADHPWYYRSYLAWKSGSAADAAGLGSKAEWWLRVYGPARSQKGIGHHPQTWMRYRATGRPAPASL